MAAWDRGAVVALALAALSVGGSLSGCFPYLEHVRPDVRGQVTTASGQGVQQAVVVACSRRWGQSSETCAHPARTTADDDGAFVLDGAREWDWCCLGEAPRWQTRVVACDGEHRSAIVDVDGASRDGVNLVVDPSLGCQESDDADENKSSMRSRTPAPKSTPNSG